MIKEICLLYQKKIIESKHFAVTKKSYIFVNLLKRVYDGAIHKIII
jgi:hypothetical protein